MAASRLQAVHRPPRRVGVSHRTARHINHSTARTNRMGYLTQSPAPSTRSVQTSPRIRADGFEHASSRIRPPGRRSHPDKHSDRSPAVPASRKPGVSPKRPKTRGNSRRRNGVTS